MEIAVEVEILLDFPRIFGLNCQLRMLPLTPFLANLLLPLLLLPPLAYLLLPRLS